jgi:hypothetical protein
MLIIEESVTEFGGIREELTTMSELTIKESETTTEALPKEDLININTMLEESEFTLDVIRVIFPELGSLTIEMLEDGTPLTERKSLLITKDGTIIDLTL